MAPKGSKVAKPKGKAKEAPQATQLEPDTQPEPPEDDSVMPAQELRNMHAHLAAMALKGDSAPKDFYKSLRDKAQKRTFFEQFKVDKKCKFVSEVVERRSDSVSDTVDVVEGWMSKPGPELLFARSER